MRSSHPPVAAAVRYGRKCAVFPVPQGTAVHVALAQVRSDLRTELSRY